MRAAAIAAVCCRAGPWQRRHRAVLLPASELSPCPSFGGYPALSGPSALLSAVPNVPQHGETEARGCTASPGVGELCPGVPGVDAGSSGDCAREAHAFLEPCLPTHSRSLSREQPLSSATALMPLTPPAPW